MTGQTMKWKFVSGEIKEELVRWGCTRWRNLSRDDIRKYLLDNHYDGLSQFAKRYKKGVKVEFLLDDFAINDLMAEIFFDYYDEVAKLGHLKLYDEQFAEHESFTGLLTEIEHFACLADVSRKRFLEGVARTAPDAVKESKKD